MESTIFQLSLLGSFIAGMVALFAPCCITFLLPSYFANIFKEKKRVVLMTFIYSLGIATVMLPVVLGAKALSQTFFELHDKVYIIGGVFLIIIAFMSLFSIKLPMPKISLTKKADDPLSTYILGVFSGITSSCCAPVLLGVITLSSLAPSMFQSFLIGTFYVLGMVTPLYVASLFIDRGNMLSGKFFKKPLVAYELFNKRKFMRVSDVISFSAFFVIGMITIMLTITGKLAMNKAEDGITQRIQDVAISISKVVKTIPGLDIVFFIIATYLFIKFLRYISSKNKSTTS